MRRASDWIGKAVITEKGDEVGKVEDLAIDSDGRIHYVTVAVASFLIDQRLIAVAPEALTPASGTAGASLRLAASATDLARAPRFTADNWPDEPSLSGAGDPPSAASSAAGTDAAPADQTELAVDNGSATITGGRRKATLSAGERRIEESPVTRHRATVAALPPIQPVDAPSGSAPSDGRFRTLDQNNDGYLDRSEIASEMTYRDRYTRVDLDANDLIDDDEFARFMQERAKNGG